MTGAAAGPAFSWNLVSDLRAIWQFEFMRNAFEAGTMIAIVAGLIGYFVVLRRSSFASHALSHTGFSGAAAAVLVGADPVFGLLIFTVASATGMALLGNRASSRDVETGTVLAFALALGLLFLSLYKGYATEAYSILFGEVLGIDTAGVAFTFWTGLAVLAVVAIIYRPLLFASLDEDVAEARGLPMLFLNLAFMVLLAVTVSIAVQIIGVFLIFALLVTPAAIAVRLTRSALGAVIISILIAVTAVWAGLFISWYEQYPVSFFVVGIVFAEYVGVRGAGVLRGAAILQGGEDSARQGIRALRDASLTAMVSQVLFFGGGILLAQSLIAYPNAAWQPALLYAHARPAIALLIPAAGIGFASFLLYFTGLRRMASGSSEYTFPAFLSLGGILGAALGLGGLVLFLVGEGLASSSNALAPLAVLFGVPLLGLGVLLAVVGFIGQALGNWRCGLRYAGGPLRTSAILMVVPPIGYALGYLGYRRALDQEPSGPASPGAPA
jgi:zinc/manganese transport system permease protein